MGAPGNDTIDEEFNFRNLKLREKPNEYRCVFWNNNDITRKYDYIPGIVFGKFFSQGERIKKPEGAIEII